MSESEKNSSLFLIVLFKIILIDSSLWGLNLKIFTLEIKGLIIENPGCSVVAPININIPSNALISCNRNDDYVLKIYQESGLVPLIYKNVFL